MRAIFKIPDNAVGWNPFDNSSRKEDEDVFLYPEELNDAHGYHIIVIPSLTKLFGDYKFFWNNQVYWVFKKFLEPTVELISEIKIDF